VVQLHHLALLDAREVLDLEVDLLADADAVQAAILLLADRGDLDAQHLADQRPEDGRRASELTREDGD
jgi:hypothetical protein